MHEDQAVFNHDEDKDAEHGAKHTAASAENAGATEHYGGYDLQLQAHEITRVGQPGHRAVQQTGKAGKCTSRAINEQHRSPNVEASTMCCFRITAHCIH